MGRTPEQPTWSLMVSSTGRIVRVRTEFANDKRRLGWIMVADEAELLPWPTAPVNVQSNPRRPPHGYGAVEDDG